MKDSTGWLSHFKNQNEKKNIKLSSESYLADLPQLNKENGSLPKQVLHTGEWMSSDSMKMSVWVRKYWCTKLLYMLYYTKIQ